MPEIRFGLLVSKDDAPETDPRQRVADHIERATAARDAGFDTIVVGHRYSYGPGSADDRGSPLISSRFQPLLVLAHMAAALGDTVNYAPLVMVSPALNPVQLAEDAATLDAMTGGRLGWASGWAGCRTSSRPSACPSRAGSPGSRNWSPRPGPC